MVAVERITSVPLLDTVMNLPELLHPADTAILSRISPPFFMLILAELLDDIRLPPLKVIYLPSIVRGFVNVTFLMGIIVGVDTVPGDAASRAFCRSSSVSITEEVPPPI